MNCDFRLTYKSGGEKKILTAPQDGGDVSLYVSDDGERRRVTVRASRETTLLG